MNVMPSRQADPNAPDRRRLANALRVLAIDAVETAKSGHPGMPMGMADIAALISPTAMDQCCSKGCSS